MRPDYVLRNGFSLWLDEKQQAGFRPVARMDPYGSSLRKNIRIVTWLRETRDGLPLTAPSDRTRGQAVIDMGAMGLTKGSWPGQQVTTLGTVVLNGWEALGVTGDNVPDEITRNIVLLQAVAKMDDDDTRTYYGQMSDRWQRLVAMQPADYWLEDLTRMMLPCYLDQTDSRGYNPFLAFVGVNGGDVGNTAEWEAWSEAQWSGQQALDALLRYISDNHRPGGSGAFRRAMEAIRVVSTAPRTLPALLDHWKIPA